MNAELQIALEKILALCRTKQTWNNADRKTLKEFREKLGTPNEIAADLGVSAATIYAWEKQIDGDELRPPPPERQLKNFTAIIAKKEQKSKFGEVLMRVRTVNEVTECGEFCKRFWIIRSGKPFVILKDKNLLNQTVKFLKGNPEVKSFFMFRAPDETESESGRKIYEAKASYEALIRQLKEHPDWNEIREKICGVPIVSEAEANKMGLVDPWTSFAMAEYSEKGYEKFGKSVDVWMEFVFDVSKNPQFEQNRQLVWLELPVEEAEKWKEQRQKFWNAALSENQQKDNSKQNAARKI